MIKLRHLNNNIYSQGQPVTGNLKCFQKGRKLSKNSKHCFQSGVVVLCKFSSKNGACKLFSVHVDFLAYMHHMHVIYFFSKSNPEYNLTGILLELPILFMLTLIRMRQDRVILSLRYVDFISK